MHCSQIPIIRLAVPFVTGIVISLTIDIPTFVICSVAAVGILLIIIYFSATTARKFNMFRMAGLGISIVFLALGAGRTGLAKKNNDKMQAILTGSGSVVLRVLDFPEKRARSVRFPGEVVWTRKNGWMRPGGRKPKVMVYLKGSGWDLSGIQPGFFYHSLKSPEEIPGPANPGVFNYRRYLADKGVYGQVFNSRKEGNVLRERDRKSLMEISRRIQHSLVSQLRSSGFSDRELAVSAALLAGERDLLDNQTEALFTGSGTMHILAISGLHVGIVYLILVRLLSLFEGGRLKKIIRFMVILSILWGYALITGLSPSVTRASLMFSIFLVGDVLGRKSHPLNLLAAAALIMLLINPFQIRAAGFQMSFLAVTSIILIYPPLYRIGKTGIRWLDYPWSLIAVSIAALAGTAPLSVYYFHQLPLLSPLVNLFVIPLTTVLVGGFMVWLVVLPLPVLQIAIAGALKFFTHLLLTIVGYVHDVPFASLQGLFPGTATVLAVYTLIILFAMYLFRRRGLYLVFIEIVVLMILVWSVTGNSHSRAQMVVFMIPGKSATGFHTPGRNYLLVHQGLEPAQNQIRYQVAPYFSGHEVEIMRCDTVSRFHSGSLNYKKGFITFAGLFGLLFDSRKPVLIKKIPDKPQLDFLVFSGRCWWNLPPLLKSVETNVVVVDGSVPDRIKPVIRGICLNHDIALYETGNSGAYMMNVRKKHFNRCGGGS